MAEIGIVYEPLNKLLAWPENPKEHDLGAIGASIARFGFRDPIAVNRRNNFIEEGHGRLEVLKFLRDRGGDPPSFILSAGKDWLVPVLYFDDDERVQYGYALAHNRTQELGGYDDEKLRSALEEEARHGLLPGTGFDNDDLEALNRRLADDAAETVPVYKITVTCETEQQQAELQARLTKEGFKAVRGS
jgi:hypothetical protein